MLHDGGVNVGCIFVGCSMGMAPIPPEVQIPLQIHWPSLCNIPLLYVARLGRNVALPFEEHTLICLNTMHGK